MALVGSWPLNKKSTVRPAPLSDGHKVVSPASPVCDAHDDGDRLAALCHGQDGDNDIHAAPEFNDKVDEATLLAPDSDGFEKTDACRTPDHFVVNGSEVFPETGDFKEFLAHFENTAKANGTMIGREGHNLTQGQFKSRFPDRDFTVLPGYGYLYCIVNSNHGIAFVKQEGEICNRKSACELTIRYRLASDRNVYLVK